MKSLILIDGDNLMHRAHNVNSKFRFKGQPTSILYGVPSMLVSLMKRYPHGTIKLFWDGLKHPVRRSLTEDGYKAHRKKNKLTSTWDEMIKQKPDLRRLVEAMGITQIHNPKFEADDLIYKYWNTKRKKNPNQKFVIVSTDKDFNQLVDDNTCIYNAFKDLEIREGNMMEHYNYLPDECVAYLCLSGDTSDDIKGVGGIGDKGARNLLNIIKAKKLIEHPQEYLTSEQAKKFELNRTLIDLRYFDKKHGFKASFKEIATPAKFNKRTYLTICAQYGLKRFQTETFYQILQ
jgi:DNA polymerase-1